MSIVSRGSVVEVGGFGTILPGGSAVVEVVGAPDVAVPPLDVLVGLSEVLEPPAAWLDPQAANRHESTRATAANRTLELRLPPSDFTAGPLCTWLLESKEWTRE